MAPGSYGKLVHLYPYSAKDRSVTGSVGQELLANSHPYHKSVTFSSPVLTQVLIMATNTSLPMPHPVNGLGMRSKPSRDDSSYPSTFFPTGILARVVQLASTPSDHLLDPTLPYPTTTTMTPSSWLCESGAVAARSVSIIRQGLNLCCRTRFRQPS